MSTPEHGVDMSVLRSRMLYQNAGECFFCTTTSPQQSQRANASKSQQKAALDKTTQKSPEPEAGASIARRIIAQPDVIKAWDHILSQESLTNNQITILQNVLLMF